MCHRYSPQCRGQNGARAQQQQLHLEAVAAGGRGAWHAGGGGTRRDTRSQPPVRDATAHEALQHISRGVSRWPPGLATQRGWDDLSSSFKRKLCSDHIRGELDTEGQRATTHPSLELASVTHEISAAVRRLSITLDLGVFDSSLPAGGATTRRKNCDGATQAKTTHAGLLYQQQS